MNEQRAVYITRVCGQPSVFDLLRHSLSFVQVDAPLQMLVTNLDFDEHKGRIAIGRVQSGKLRKGDTIVFTKPGTAPWGSLARYRITSAPGGGSALE